jgi:tetraacyldisaccharide 4'-kinase
MKNLKLPHFWYSQDDNSRSRLLSIFLIPCAWVYRFFCFIHRAITAESQSPIPLICVGNVTVGGAGKTPTSRMLLDIIKEHEKFNTVCFLMRGYGGNYSGAMEVDPSAHTTWDVGDEALMQAQYAPVIVSRSKKKGAELAAEIGYDIIIMDDGFQNPTIRKNFSLLVIDGQFGFGNGRCLPAGPLREPVLTALKRTHCALIINRSNEQDLSILKDQKSYDAILKLHTKKSETSQTLQDNEKIIAFAGISRPEKFFQTLKDNGFEVHSKFGFPDHHVYTHGQINALYQRSQKTNARLVTTEKDWIRLSKSWKEKIDYVKISVIPDDEFKDHFFNILDKL